jgi:hypothetical protein
MAPVGGFDKTRTSASVSGHFLEASPPTACSSGKFIARRVIDVRDLPSNPRVGHYCGGDRRALFDIQVTPDMPSPWLRSNYRKIYRDLPHGKPTQRTVSRMPRCLALQEAKAAVPSLKRAATIPKTAATGPVMPTLASHAVKM